MYHSTSTSSNKGRRGGYVAEGVRERREQRFERMRGSRPGTLARFGIGSPPLPSVTGGDYFFTPGSLHRRPGA